MQSQLDGCDTCRSSAADIAVTGVALAFDPVAVAAGVDTAVMAHAAVGVHVAVAAAAAAAADTAAVIAVALIGSAMEVAVANVYHWTAAAMKSRGQVKVPVVPQYYYQVSPKPVQ